MKKIILILAMLVFCVSNSQTTTHRSRVKIKKAPTSQSTDNVVARNPSTGLITDTGITVAELSAGGGGSSTTGDFVPLEAGSTGGVSQGSNFIINQASSLVSDSGSNTTFTGGATTVFDSSANTTFTNGGAFFQGMGSTLFDLGATTIFTDGATTTFDESSTTSFSGGSNTIFDLGATTTFTNSATTTFTNGAIFQVEGTNTYIGNGTTLSISDGATFSLANGNTSIDIENVNIVSGIENGFTTGLQYAATDNHQFVDNSLITKSYVDNNQVIPTLEQVVGQGNVAIENALIIEELALRHPTGNFGANITMGETGGITPFPFIKFPTRGGQVAIVDETSNTLNMPNIPVYNTESDAQTGGLSTGDIYRTVTGELRIKL